MKRPGDLGAEARAGQARRGRRGCRCRVENPDTLVDEMLRMLKNRFSEDVGVTDASAGSETGKIAVHCESATAVGTDVGSGADGSEQTPSADVTNGEELVRMNGRARSG